MSARTSINGKIDTISRKECRREGSRSQDEGAETGVGRPDRIHKRGRDPGRLEGANEHSLAGVDPSNPSNVPRAAITAAFAVPAIIYCATTLAVSFGHPLGITALLVNLETILLRVSPFLCPRFLCLPLLSRPSLRYVNARRAISLGS